MHCLASWRWKVKIESSAQARLAPPLLSLWLCTCKPEKKVACFIGKVKNAGAEDIQLPLYFFELSTNLGLPSPPENPGQQLNIRWTRQLPAWRWDKRILTSSPMHCNALQCKWSRLSACSSWPPALGRWQGWLIHTGGSIHQLKVTIIKSYKAW